MWEIGTMQIEAIVQIKKKGCTKGRSLMGVGGKRSRLRR
jgi:hypothetical protein